MIKSFFVIQAATVLLTRKVSSQTGKELMIANYNFDKDRDLVFGRQEGLFGAESSTGQSF